MMDFEYLMTTKIYFGKDIISKSGDVIGKLGKKAFIITGKTSSKKNGSLNDVEQILKKLNIDYCIFDEVEENPSLETVEKASNIGREEKVDFIIGIGGGSPIDSAKAIGVLINNPSAKIDDIFSSNELKSAPLIAVPTTAGTGTEVTPYAIFTDHRLQTKRNFSQKVFPDIAFLDAKYLIGTPIHITINTAVDALSHLIEGYLAVKANVISDSIAEKGFRLFSECMNGLKSKNISYEDYEKLLLTSTLAGIVIAQTSTSLPHGMGYALTYFHGISHGKANGLLLKEYLELSSSMTKVQNILTLLNINDVDEFGKVISGFIGNETSITEEEILKYTKAMISNGDKLKNHPIKVSEEDIFNMYKKSLL